MKRRILSALLALVMILSMVPAQVFAVPTGNGSSESPWQIGDTVTNDGSAEPEGICVENSYWVREDISAAQTLVCQQEEHDHSDCEEAEAVCTAEHECGDGTECIYASAGYGCGVEAHTHNASCVEETEGYTLWTLTERSARDNTPYLVEDSAEVEQHAKRDAAAPLAVDDGLPIHYFLAAPGDIVNPNGRYINYGTVSNNRWPESYAIEDIENDPSWRQIKTENGIRNVYDESIITDYVAYWPNGDAEAFKEFGSVTINGTTYTDDQYEIKWVTIAYRDNNSAREGLYCQQYGSANYEHIHIDGLLVEKIQPGDMEVYKSIPTAAEDATTFHFTLEKMQQEDLVTPPESADDVDESFEPLTLTASIPAGRTQAQIVGGDEISFGYYKLTENDHQEWINDGIMLTDASGHTQSIDTDTLYICIAPNGTVQYSVTPSGPYLLMNRVEVQNTHKAYDVTYQWRVFNLDGSITENLPASVGAHGLPAQEKDMKYGSEYVYNTGFVQGTSYHDYENGLLYTFHGWDTWSHNSSFGVDPTMSGYNDLDDGDANASNNKTVPITDDTWINGYWTVSELEAADAYLLVHKDVVVESGDAQYVNNYLNNVGKMYISIDPGIDKDGDGVSQIDVDYPGAVAEGGYLINVYQYAVPFVFTEHDAEVPGYTKTVDIQVTGDNLTLTAENGDEATVTITEEYDPAQAPHNLGTVTYINTYTKKIGAAVTEYPELTIVKHAVDTGLLQEGAVFTLYSDAACTDVITTFTTDSNGVAHIDFETLLANVSGTYTAYLKETAAPAGYLVNDAVCTLTLTPSETEELRGGEFVTVTTYALRVTSSGAGDVELTQDANTAQKFSLNVFNNPIIGAVTVKKEAVGLDEADESLLQATVTIHGPISRGDQGQITDEGNTYLLYLNEENEWTDGEARLPIGEYLIHENMASVHGYTWDMENVDYGALPTEVYNDITSGVFEITADQTQIEVTITNTYTQWSAADFYIRKMDPAGTRLGDATFQLYSDEACTEKVTDSGITTVATTGANGIAVFSGYTVPEGSTSVTYYLKETKAPAGFYLSDTVYKVEIKAVTGENDEITFEPKISVKSNGQWVEASNFSNTDDGLTVTNVPVKGQISIVKNMVGAPAELTSVTLYVTGPNHYTEEVTLTREGQWKATLTDLVLGEYTIVEEDAEAPGYDLVTTYLVDGNQTSDKATVVLEETTPGYTTSSTVALGAATVTNTYTRREETVENPASLTVKKVGEDGTTPLAGAVFTLVRDRDGASVSYTTNANGEVEFFFLSGVIDGGEVVEGKYTLTETTPPDGYAAADTTWKITVKEKDGKVTIKLNEDTNIFENIWDWIIGGIVGKESTYTFENNVLKVINLELADMTISKTFVGATPPAGAIIEVAVFDSNSKLVQQVELTETNSWTAKLENLPADTYTVRENSPSLHGYTWQKADFVVTGVDAKDVTASNSSVEVKVADSADVQVEITNTYTAWEAADFYILKTKEDGDTPLQGAKFNLYDENGVDVTDDYLHIDESIHTNNGNATGTGGILHFHDFKVAAGATAVFTLKETAPDNYYDNTNVYKIVVDHTTDAYDITVTREDGTALTVENDNAKFNHSNDVLTVVNEEILADLVIKKTFPASDLVTNSVKVDITGPNGYSNTVTLGAGNNFEVTVKDLSLGEYTVKEQDAAQDGYTLTVKYDGEMLDETTVTLTEDNDETAAVVNIQNTYLLDQHNPASFQIKKVDSATGNVITTGAEFTLYSDAECTQEVQVQQTGDDGIATFSGFTQAATYYLKETAAPNGYELSDTVWTVTVSLKNGEPTIKINEQTNLWESIYDWIAGIDHSDWKDGVLTVKNEKKTGQLTVIKAVVDPEGYYANAEYSFTLDASDNAFDAEFTLKAGESKTLKNVPYGTTYTVTENTTGAAYTSAVTDSGNGKVWAEETTVTVTNTYAYQENNPGLNLLKVDADTAEPIEGAVFHVYYDAECTNYMNSGTSDGDGKLNIPFHYYDYETYYLKEYAPAAGYYPNDTVYVISAETVYTVKNAGTDDAYTEKAQILTISILNKSGDAYVVENTAIKPVSITVTKSWDDGGYHARPEEITVALYCDGQEYDNKTLNEGNSWSYTWEGAEFTDQYTWTVDEKETPESYTKSDIVDSDADPLVYVYNITNTRAPKPVEITVTKAWEHKNGKTLPESIDVTLYKNGEVHETVTLNEDNSWTHTWTGLTDVYEWSVDETAVPTGYEKQIQVDGYSFTITNTRIVQPITVSVEKVWKDNNSKDRPESVDVVLYQNGEVYETVTLNAENDWSYSWDLTDEYDWTVDEPTVPTDYKKAVTHNGNSWTVTNTLKKIPQTGDDADLLSLRIMGIVGVVGFACCACLMFAPRKKKEKR